MEQTTELDFEPRTKSLFQSQSSIYFSGTEKVFSILDQEEFNALLENVKTEAIKYSVAQNIPLISWDDYCDEESNGGVSNDGEPYNHGIVLEMFIHARKKFLGVPYTTGWISVGDPIPENALFDAIQLYDIRGIVIEAFVS